MGKVTVAKNYLRKWRLDPSRRKGRAEETGPGLGISRAPGAAEAPCPPFSLSTTPPASLGLHSPAPTLCSKTKPVLGNQLSLTNQSTRKSESTTASIYSDSSSASYKCQQESDSCRITLHFIMFQEIQHFLQIEGLWPPCIRQIYQHHFSNSIIIFDTYLFGCAGS